MPTVPLELRIWTAILASPLLWLAWLGSWLRFVSMAIDVGSAQAAVDRLFWLRATTVAVLDGVERGARDGIYSIRVVRAALKPYYPKEESRP